MIRAFCAAVLALLLTTATAAAPARQACDEAIAPYRISREVDIRGLPVGRVVAWSCTSWDDALDQAAAGEAEIRQNSCARYERCN